MNLTDTPFTKPSPEAPDLLADEPREREVLQVVLQLLGMLLPAVAYWTWRAARLDAEAQASELGLLALLDTLAVLGLMVWHQHGLAVRVATGLLGLALLAWALGAVAWGGDATVQILLPFLSALTAATVAGLVASSRALATARQDLVKARHALNALEASEALEMRAAGEAGKGDVDRVANPGGAGNMGRSQLETLFSKAFELSPLGMTLSRVSDGVFLALNAASQRIQGYRPEELIGRSALDQGTWLHSAERQKFLQQVREHPGPFEMESRVRSKDGTWVDCRVWATLVDVDGEACLMCATLDITQQKRRESLLLDLTQGLALPVGEPFLRSAARYLAKAINADLVMVAEIHTETGASARLATLALWKDQAQVANTSFDPAQAPFAAVLASSDLVLLDAPDGLRYPDSPGAMTEPGDRFRSCAGLALRDADGTPIGLLCAWWRGGSATTGEQASLFRIVASRSTAELIRLHRDREIFRLKESLELRVQARTEQLRASNAELESFGYSVSHDLQSPLRSIQGFLFLLERRLKPRLSTEEERLIERITANVKRMHELINDLLALTRVSKGQLLRESVNLSDIAERLLADYQLAAPDRRVRLRIAPNLTAHCDAKLARIVLENLLGNAWKYSRKTELTDIEFGALASGADEPATFFIQDNGAGFNMDYASSLFKPFHRLHHEDEYEGSGIGLATVHRILERHGGSIRAEAVEGSGACFYFTFDQGPSAPEL